MSNHEACELLIEQQIEEGLKEGKTPYSIGKELSTWVEKLFDSKIKPDTIKKRAQRQSEKLGTNVPKESKTPEIKTDLIEDRRPQGGGKREGAGRPKAEPVTDAWVCDDEPSSYKPIDPDHSMAERYAYMATSQMKQIMYEDKCRDEAFIIILEWVEKHWPEGGVTWKKK